MDTVEALITNLRSVVGAKNDAELARQLDIDQSTISSWRARGRVPVRFTKILDTPNVGAKPDPDHAWPEMQERATAVALARFVMLRRHEFEGPATDLTLARFLDIKPFWLLMNRAVLELRTKIDALKIDLATAAALVLQEDLRDPDATIKRVTQQLSEDLADNPWLKEWK
ncbi:MAG: helix-turn-helix domain-containing protein [Paracoccaceae bacterium]